MLFLCAGRGIFSPRRFKKTHGKDPPPDNGPEKGSNESDFRAEGEKNKDQRCLFFSAGKWNPVPPGARPPASLRVAMEGLARELEQQRQSEVRGAVSL